jgi:hypothetical protein
MRHADHNRSAHPAAAARSGGLGIAGTGAAARQADLSCAATSQIRATRLRQRPGRASTSARRPAGPQRWQTSSLRKSPARFPRDRRTCNPRRAIPNRTTFWGLLAGDGNRRARRRAQPQQRGQSTTIPDCSAHMHMRNEARGPAAQRTSARTRQKRELAWSFAGRGTSDLDSVRRSQSDHTPARNCCKSTQSRLGHMPSLPPMPLVSPMFIAESPSRRRPSARRIKHPGRGQ